MTSIADLVDDASIAALVTDAAIIEGGVELAGTGAVRVTASDPLRVLAEVDDGGGIAEVELASLNDALFWTCTCADGQEGRPCRHFVAVARITRDQATSS